MNPTIGYSRITTKGGLDSPIGAAYQFVQDTWELPKDFLPLTSTEGEGAILLNLQTNRVYDFNLDKYNQLLNGELKPTWDSFYEFLNWYLT